MSQEAVASQPTSADPTSLSAAQANILASSIAQIARLNADLIVRYHSAYADYGANMQSGGFIPPDRRVPPKPPMAWELAGPNADGFVFYQVGTTPVCDPLPAINYNGGLVAPSGGQSGNYLTEGQIDIGNFAGGVFWSAGPADTWPINKPTPPLPAGPTYPAGVYRKWPAPVGSVNITWPDGTVGTHGGWYEKVG